MDMSTISASLASLQSSIATVALSKAMGKDAQSMATLIGDLEAAVPTPAPSFGGMDIRV